MSTVAWCAAVGVLAFAAGMLFCYYGIVKFWR